MAVTAKWYGLGYDSVFDKEIDWLADTIKVALCTNAYVPDQDTHQYFNQITNEFVGAGYVAGGATLAGKTQTYVGGTNTFTLDANDAFWAAATVTARYAIIYLATGVAATSPLLLYVDNGVDFCSSAGNLTVVWNASGIASVTVA